ncbi:hypothetical protein [Brevibacillus marinus]|uniref:hypothetical protein n=1 Tax=Brevibacillus marinus TaxID=2496837 RepID=UPI000F837ED4|nr:hypothetical protein [Brevibacillus marinus]
MRSKQTWFWLLGTVLCFVGIFLLLVLKNSQGLLPLSIGVLVLCNAYFYKQATANKEWMKQIREKSGFLAYIASLVYTYLLFLSVQYGWLEALDGIWLSLNLMIVTMSVILFICSRKNTSR